MNYGELDSKLKTIHFLRDKHSDLDEVSPDSMIPYLLTEILDEIEKGPKDEYSQYSTDEC